VVQHLPSKYEALSSNPHTARKIKNKKPYFQTHICFLLKKERLIKILNVVEKR
jgi:hypothetical protein